MRERERDSEPCTLGLAFGKRATLASLVSERLNAIEVWHTYACIRELVIECIRVGFVIIGECLVRERQDAFGIGQ